MCEPASFVIVKDGRSLKALWSKDINEHHESIIEYFNLREQNVRKEITLVRVEVRPPVKKDGTIDFSAPFSKWVFRTDQDLLPVWYDEKEAERVARKELKEWRKEKVVLPNQKVKCIYGGYKVAVMGTINAVRGGTINSVRGGTINVVSGGTINVVDGGTINAVRCGTINAVHGGTINAVRGGTINSVRGGTINVVSGGTINDVSGGTISSVWGGTINHVHGGTINAVRGGPTITAYDNKIYDALCKKVSKGNTQAVIINRSVSPAKVQVGALTKDQSNG